MWYCLAKIWNYLILAHICTTSLPHSPLSGLDMFSRSQDHYHLSVSVCSTANPWKPALTHVDKLKINDGQDNIYYLHHCHTTLYVVRTI